MNQFSIEEPEKLTLDKESLKAITVETRVKILKVLANKQQTLSDLSQLLGLSAPTLKEHLNVLEKVTMINKLEEGRKWKYYKITEKGLCMIYPERKRIWITLSLLGLSVVATTISVLRSSSSQALMKLSSSASAFEQAEGTLAAATPMAQTAARTSFNFWPLVFPTITLILIIVLIYYLIKYRKRKK